MRSMLKMRELLHALFVSKIFSLPIPTRPGTRTFLQVPDPSRPEDKNPYPSDPADEDMLLMILYFDLMMLYSELEMLFSDLKR